MNNKYNKVVSAAVSCMVVASLSSTVSADNVLLKTPIAYSSKLPAMGTSIVRVSEQMARVSGGTIKMKIYEPNKLISATEILGAVDSGKVNSGFATAGNWQGKIPAAAIFSSVPFGPEAGEYMAWLYYGNGLKLYQEMYDTAGYNVKVIPCAILSPETSGWFSKPINTPADLQGLNMRFFGLGAAVMEKLGVNTTQLPSSEIFGALEKGAIDATEFAQPAIDQRLGFSKVAKYNYFPGWHQQSTIYELLVNKDTWQEMNDSQQAVVENVCKASMADSFAEGEASQFSIMKEAKENGVEIRYWSDEMLAAFKSKWDEVVVEMNQDPVFKKAYDDLSTFRDGYDIWEANAFLPRGATR